MVDLDVQDLTIEYSSGGYVVRPIDCLSISAKSGELVLLLGPSGCGKTSLLSCLAAILSPASGQVTVGDKTLSKLTSAELTDYRRHTVGIVFQAFNLIPSLTALENVEAPLRAARVRYRQARERAEQLLTRVGLEDRMEHRPGDLSGGQQQRVAIARALAFDPPLLLADEPTAHLDYIQVEGVLRILRDLARPERLVVVATHDERLMPLADRVVELTPRFGEAARGPQREALVPGQILFEQGSRGELIYIVESGEVELLRTRADGSEEKLAVSRPGDYFGELGPLLGFPRAATARAHGAAAVTGYSVRDFRELVGPARIAEVLSGRRPTPRKSRSNSGQG